MIKEFDNFIQNVELEINKSQIALCEYFQKFINGVSESLNKIEAKKGDTEGNTNLIGGSLMGLKVDSELNNIDFVLYGENLGNTGTLPVFS